MRTLSTIGLALASCTLGAALLNTSHNGLCGNGVSCAGSMFGGCCSSFGHCGSTADYCGAGCQLEYGYCEDTHGKHSPDGTCGGGNAFTCKDSVFGNCCSQYNYCGSSEAYCGAACQSEFGSCSTSYEPTATATWSRLPAPTSLKHFGMGRTHSGVETNNCTSGAISMITSAIPTTVSMSDSTPVSKSACSACPAQTHTPDPAECVPCQGQSGTLPYCGADVATNNYHFTPKTCRTVYYHFEITNTTLAPDGIPRMVLLVNGQMPGPPIEANWGDTVVVTVDNKLQTNGTSIHFHGIRHLNSSEYDGVPSVTQCPIAPGDSMTYTFVATTYGTSWYHSHFAIQTWEGVMGPMIIYGPSSKKWDVDAGTILLQDWSHSTVDSMYSGAEDALEGGPLKMDNGLINGLNTWGVDGTNNQTGRRFELSTKFEPGKTYLFRIINAAIQSTYKFYIDGHTLEVINMDFTAIEPYETDILNINIGQRYMVLVKADQPVGDYWMRSDNQNACAMTLQADDIKGIVRYVGSPGTTPTSTKYPYTSECIDEPLSSLVPISPLSATTQDVNFAYDISIRANTDHMYRWYLSNKTFISHYEDPTLLQVLSNESYSSPNYEDNNLALALPDLNKWVYIIMESDIPLPHPIHLHGHDFFVLAAGPGRYNSNGTNITKLNLANPPRRDTAMLPAAGHLVVAFLTDNPGAWLMHCHIGWHVSMGFALQLLEGGVKDIKRSVKDEYGLTETCRKWTEWTSANGYKQFDSGVKI